MKISSICKCNKMLGLDGLHPLVSVSILSQAGGECVVGNECDFYRVVFLKSDAKSNVCGCCTYDFQTVTVLFLPPGRKLEVMPHFEVTGKALLFHPKLFFDCELETVRDSYPFFEFSADEALHLSMREYEVVNDSLTHISAELSHYTDKYSRMILVKQISLFLDYCKRYYERQFATRCKVNEETMRKIDGMVGDYYSTDKPLFCQYPPVSYFAPPLHFSEAYLREFIRFMRELSFEGYLKERVVNIAAHRIDDGKMSIEEISRGLGFKSARQFSSVFRSVTGASPSKIKG